MQRFLTLSLRFSAPALLLAVLAGCATTDSQQSGRVAAGGMHAAIDDSEIPPVATPRRPLDGLLEDAGEALHLANAAQEAGDPAEARRQYTLMLELLIEADLDPDVFYALREPLGNIVDTSVRQAAVYPVETQDPSQIELDGGVYIEQDGIVIPNPLPYRVEREIERIKNDYPSSFQRGLDRSQKYLPYIEAEFVAAGLPKELAWIAIVESNFWPTAVSRSSAGGMWQFMKGTAMQYKLRVDGRADAWVDERYDWQSATRAAIEYLSFLSKTFDGDWALAVTAYNMGEGALERAIAANGGQRNLWALLETPPASNRIHLEGKQYYAKFLASLIVAQDPEAYGFTTNNLPPEQIAKIPVKGMYGLEDLDVAMGYTPGTLARFNPDLLKGITPPEHTGAYRITVPHNDRPKLQTALKKVTPLKYGNTTHRVARGETFSGIAQRYNVSWRELMHLNGYSAAKDLRMGKVLRIPGYQGEVVAESAPTSTTTGTATYTVRRGDTLYDIAKLQGVTIQDLQAWNNMGTSTRLRPGQKLRARAASVAATPTATPATVQSKPTYHVVRANEYPEKIARNFGISLQELLSLNGLNRNSKIYVGQRLIVGRSTESAVASAGGSGTKTIYTVKAGDTAGAIAEQHSVGLSDLLRWNDLSASSTLNIGDELTVYAPDGIGAMAAAAPSAKKRVYTVRRGQNPTTIARVNGVKVDELFQWNNWSRGHVLQVGDEVVIYRD